MTRRSEDNEAFAQVRGTTTWQKQCTCPAYAAWYGCPNTFYVTEHGVVPATTLGPRCSACGTWWKEVENRPVSSGG